MTLVGPIARVTERLFDDIRRLSGTLGHTVRLDSTLLTDRARWLGLTPGGLWSWNRSCRLIRAADGWIAVNLPRDCDRLSVPAWVGCTLDAPPWDALIAAARMRPTDDLVRDGRLLGLAVSRVGEAAASGIRAPVLRLGEPRDLSRRRPLNVLDLSGLWAGPLCGAVLARAGAQVTKLESSSRPDGSRGCRAFFDSLNAGKDFLALDFNDPEDRAALRRRIRVADVVITSARPRAFEGLGITPEAVFAANPGLVWVAITGHGWRGEAGDWIGFGDDAAAAGGLLDWRGDQPCFAGDALADPLTGLAAAVGALEALAQGGGVLVDAALSRTAAGVLARSGLEAAA